LSWRSGGSVQPYSGWGNEEARRGIVLAAGGRRMGLKQSLPVRGKSMLEGWWICCRLPPWWWSLDTTRTGSLHFSEVSR
jgi:hypothetical protein